jgi:hypothetical protein
MLLCTQCTLDTTEEVLTDFEQIQKESRVADIDFPEKVDTFFINQVQDSTLLKLIHRFKSNLKDSAKIETLNQYIQSYGYPLWEQFFYTRLDEGFLYAIPVAKDGDKIETIWFFKVTGKRLHSFSTNRKTLSSFDWMYDYFTSNLYFKPNSEKTRIKNNPQSRAERCSTVRIYHVDEYGQEQFLYEYTHCWDDGTGGGSDYVYEDDNEGEDGHDEDIDYEVAPPPDGGGGGSSVEQEQNNKIAVSTILSDNAVKIQIANAVSKMKSDLTKGRREYGFWIFYDSKNSSIYIGNMKSGDLATGTTKASLIPGSNSPSANGSHIPSTATAVAFFHTHTAMTYMEEGKGRKVGISKGDFNFAKASNVIMIVEDYVGTYDARLGYNIIKSKHNINGEMKTYVYEP